MIIRNADSLAQEISKEIPMKITANKRFTLISGNKRK